MSEEIKGIDWEPIDKVGVEINYLVDTLNFYIPYYQWAKKNHPSDYTADDLLLQMKLLQKNALYLQKIFRDFQGTGNKDEEFSLVPLKKQRRKRK